MSKEKKRGCARSFMIGSVVFLGIVVVLIAISPESEDSGEPEKEAAVSEKAEPEEPKTEEEILQEKIESQFSAWDGSHVLLERRVKEAMNDPKSFEHVETRYRVEEDEGEIYLQMDFRGNNSFGAKVLNTVEAYADLESGEILEMGMME